MAAPIDVLLIIVLGGGCGGLAGFFLDRDAPGRARSPGSELQADIYFALRRMFVGAAAALIVPLVLSLAQSSLMKELLAADTAASAFDFDLYVLAGFCVLAGFAARWFAQTVAKEALSVAREAHRRSGEAKSAADRGTQAATEAREKAVVAENVAEDLANRNGEPPAPAPEPELRLEPLRPLDADEIAILNALAKEPYKRRTLASLALDSELAEDAVPGILARLEQQGLAYRVKSVLTRNALYGLTALGRAARERQGSPP